MRKTLNTDDVRGAGSRRWALTATAVLLAGTLVAACGGGKDKAAIAEKERAQQSDVTADAAPPPGVDEKQTRLAAT
jgi:hypothetical protein